MSNILVVDDEERMRHLLSIMLQRRGFKVDQAGNGVDALSKMESGSYDMVISDIKMPKMDGLALIKRINMLDCPCPVVFITAFATIDSSVEAMRLGAVDYITKPFEEDRIILTVERTLNISRLMVENRTLKMELGEKDSEYDLIFASKAMEMIMELASKVAVTNSAVMITGESGTGKELLARYIHQKSDRRHKRFVPVNCAAISSQLLESELFGYEKGAFTGADRRKQGKFEFASEGTLFLDEIGDLPLDAQAKLLRALQERKINRVGGNEEIPVDVRVLCATNQNLEEMVDAGTFRKDLFFRINVFPIHMPPLRDRTEDIIPIARHFLKSHGPGFSLQKDAEQILNSYHWPGNVRELGNVVERSVILSFDSRSINSDSLFFLNNGAPKCLPTGFKLPVEGIDLEKLENDFVKQALEITDNNQSAAAKLLGLTRAKFRVLMKQAEDNK
ncbi:sigma-54-dependent transcriptional regulator [Desulforegula conservatrix]|uniref:sigma-54-dependent transcriptional regulator n=1 Tax=Desulforegula conservatrix TaxID=153026 RepID=UPI00040DC97B|nr:sigma-54 dependent transcriptional regulator [Desulforegula conservatrix]